MRLLIALAGGFTAYMLAGLLLDVAPTFTRTRRPARRGRLHQWLVQVDSPLTPMQFVAASAGVGVAAWVVLGLLMGEWFSSFFPAVACSGYLAWTYERRRRERLRAIAEAWPDAIRHLLSYVRSGSTIPLAVNALATHGPAPLGLRGLGGAVPAARLRHRAGDGARAARRPDLRPGNRGAADRTRMGRRAGRRGPL